MSTKTDALAALKTLMASIDPSPEPGPANIYVYPTDYASVSFDTLPVVIISEVVNTPMQWRIETYASTRDNWQAEVAVFLMNGPILNDSQGATAEQKHAPWPAAMETLLYGNQKLAVSPEAVIGQGEVLFDYQIGGLSWWSSREFWGIRFLLPIEQEYEH